MAEARIKPRILRIKELKIIAILWIILLSSCSTKFYRSEFFINSKNAIQEGGITILPILSQGTINDDQKILDKDKIIHSLQEQLIETMTVKYPGVRIILPEEFLKEKGHTYFSDIYENRCNKSYKCLMESIGNVIKTRTCLFVKDLKITKHHNPCEFFFCLIGTKYTAYFDGIIWDNQSDEEIAKLSGVACGFSGIGIYLLPPFVWPMISTPQGTIKKSCEASFQSHD